MVPIQFSGRNIEITPILRDFVNSKFVRIQKHADRITSIHVYCNVDKLSQIAEGKIHLPGTEIYASAQSEDMYKTIDLLVDKLVRQLDKHKGKSEGGKKRG
ncbi:MAG: ribosome-associated translation inhibitor RaiA [Gammaproteobacteria bacterium]|nr:ribosome-associated translation inhibitor RaiA [Gammaproteobacteria bacterium]